MRGNVRETRHGFIRAREVICEDDRHGGYDCDIVDNETKNAKTVHVDQYNFYGVDKVSSFEHQGKVRARTNDYPAPVMSCRVGNVNGMKKLECTEDNSERAFEF